MIPLPWPDDYVPTKEECLEAGAAAQVRLFDAAYGPGNWRPPTAEEAAAEAAEFGQAQAS